MLLYDHSNFRRRAFHSPAFLLPSSPIHSRRRDGFPNKAPTMQQRNSSSKETLMDSFRFRFLPQGFPSLKSQASIAPVSARSIQTAGQTNSWGLRKRLQYHPYPVFRLCGPRGLGRPNAIAGLPLAASSLLGPGHSFGHLRRLALGLQDFLL